MREIIIRSDANADRADKQARELIAELRDGELPRDVLWALDDVNLPDKVDARVRDWIGDIRSATPGGALPLERLIDAYRALVVLYLGAFHYRPCWPADEQEERAIPNLEMRERTPSVPIHHMQVAIAHLTLALHGEPARDPLREAMLTEAQLLRSIAEKAAEKIGRGSRAG